MGERSAAWLGELGPALVPWYAGVGPCHDLSHVVRVAVLVERIAAAENVEADAAVLAALLHDAGHAAAARAGTDDHEQRSARIAADLLGDRVPAPTLAQVLDAIAGRRFRKLGLPREPVGAVLDDADNLDALGYAGVARAFLWLGEHGRPDDQPDPASDLVAIAGRDAAALRRHWTEKLARLPAAMRTPTGRRLAAERAERLTGFLLGQEDELAELLSAPAPGDRSSRGPGRARAPGRPGTGW